MRLRLIPLFLLLALGLVGCSNRPQMPPPTAFDHPMRQALLAEYSDWAGTPYRLGGHSPQGVDCSGFIQQVYLGLDQRKLPRTTAEQAKLGHKIARDALQPGDLVFFKTGFKQRHAGIYLGNGEFMHASTRRGVMVSRLDNPYWLDVWWMARRP